jgi:hypothetical protein
MVISISRSSQVRITESEIDHFLVPLLHLIFESEETFELMAAAPEIDVSAQQNR